MKDALYNAAKTRFAGARILWSQDGQKLIPSVTRVFSKSRELYVYVQTYQRDAATMCPLVAFVTFYRGDAEGVSKRRRLAVVEGLDPEIQIDSALS